jgi:hypothetical protein
MTLRKRALALTALATVAAILAGCGSLIDQDLIRIAKIKDRYITRGDFDQMLRDLPDDERPIIKNKGDIQRVLRSYIDDEIKQDLAKQLEQEGKISVPREQAAQLFDAQNPEFLQMINATNLEEYQLLPQDIEVMKVQRENGIDKLHRKLLGEAAVGYRIEQAVQNGTLNVTPAELQEEYKLRKDEFVNFEQILFVGVRFMGDERQAHAQAAQVMERIKNGEAFEAIVEQYRAANPDTVIEAGIENNPNLIKFRGFWQQVSGAQEGEIRGPVFMPPSQRVDELTGEAVEMPGGVMVLKVIAHTPEQTMTLEEAANLLAAPILYAKMMKQLNQEYKVEIYDDKLPDPTFLADPDSGMY